ncbi:diacylglycerol kinase [Sporanaerobium hydrogeniformans]|uniref:Diacylglycerol kinase n=1 Tax=Sporanaerobium hydrogeniformans TaxID=3072179 RepID=A0AC61DB54_9FIRM|nr:dihydrofolate reductase [Sporanaerobium hydrogeniformans]PHV70504.1 diacylglycerol kinase [Sporanaerobium hydrogeniformans]
MIYLIVATSKNNQIGIAGQMPWHIPEDLAYFRRMTKGHTVLMGRKTFESIGRPLPHRQNIVLTHDKNFHAEGVTTLHSMKEALAFCKTQEIVFIIGGGEIYKAFLPYASRLYITLVDKDVEGDTTFCDYKDSFRCVSSVPSETPASDGSPFYFTIWEPK